MKPAVIVVDMLRDTLESDHRSSIKPFALKIVPAINRLTEAMRSRSMPVIFAMDSFLSGDFIFQGKMKEHSIRGTRGAEVTDLLQQRPTDLYLPKRRFSAFFKTDLDQILRLQGVDTVAIAGIATQVCVLTTALDALSNDFRACIIEDCCASFSREIHEKTLDIYRENALYPLLKVLTLEEFFKELEQN
jgi:nicotinamidase/pyrazinamidase